MKADELFLERCQQIERLLVSMREIELLDLTGLLATENAAYSPLTSSAE